MKTLILGGVRSGKSRTAAGIAGASTDPRGRDDRPGAAPRERDGAQARTVTLIATATALDAEMAARIAAHRASRPRAWTVIEEPLRLAAVLRRAASAEGVVIVDCLTLWLTNLMLSGDAEALTRESDALLDALPALDGEIILVSNEVGFGIVPANELARRFADAAGTLHQSVAARCDRLVMMVAGEPLIVRGPALGARAA